MAQLVAVCRVENHQFRRRQLPLVVDDSLTMVVEFVEPCNSCRERPAIVQSELDAFVRSYQQLTSEQLSSAVKISRVEILNQVSQLITCVGCRHSVERLFDELTESACSALDPFTVSKMGVVTVTPECRRDPKSLYTLTHVNRSNGALEMTSKVKKGKRCPLHSLDLHKSKALWTWNEVWDVANKECRDEITQIDNDSLLLTVEEYLRKHRFCTECKSKVLRAYGILVDDADISGIASKLDRSSTGGQCRALFREVKACSGKRHIHVPCDEKYLKDLIERAEPELSGNHMERHAKSMEIAQEEVLTCLGVHLHDRFFRIQQKLKVEGKAWQLLFGLSVDSLRRNIEVMFERSRGGGCQSVDMICRELMLEDEKTQLQASGSAKRPRSKKKKPSKAAAAQTPDVNGPVTEAGAKKNSNNCLCTSGSGMQRSDANHNRVISSQCSSATPSVCSDVDGSCLPGLAPVNGSCCTMTAAAQSRDQQTGPSDTGCGSRTGHSDPGYGSDGDCESCSSSSLTTRGGVVESEHSQSSGCCSPSSSAVAVETDVPAATCECDQLGIKCRSSCQVVIGSCSPASSITAVNGDTCSLSRHTDGLSLEDMLMASEDDSGDFEISEDVIRQYRANAQAHARERLALRQTLREKFQSMQQQQRNNMHWHDESVSPANLAVNGSAGCKDVHA